MADHDQIARFCAATVAGDVDAVLRTLAPDAELHSPLARSAVFRGRHDLQVLFSALLPALSGLTWRHVVRGADVTVAVAEARVLRVSIADAMVIETDGDGRIRRLTPHIRPWLGATLLAVVLGPELVRKPGVIRRALGPGPR